MNETTGIGTRFVRCWVFLLGVGFTVLPLAGAAVPETVNVSGSVVDTSGLPVSGTFAYEIQFYDAAEEGSALGSVVSGTTTLSAQGMFNIAVAPSASVLSASQAWYSLALDTDNDGLDADDRFANRFAVRSVPFTRRAGDADLLNGQDGSYYLDAANLTGTVPGANLALTDADVPDDITIAEASDALLLEGQPGSYYLDAANLTGTVPGARLALTDTDVPDAITVDQADDALALGGTPAADYATNSELNGAISTHSHRLEDVTGSWAELENLSATPTVTADKLYQKDGKLFFETTELTGEPGDVEVYPNQNGDYVINTDTIVVGSLSVGLDSASGYDFGYDTLALRENNLRIYFDDTSGSGSFPSTDWRLTANDSANGGRNYFGIEDDTNGTLPLYVGANAPTDSLVIDEDTGHVGLQTASPRGRLELAEANPALQSVSQESQSTTLQAQYVAQSFVAPTTGTLQSVDVSVSACVATYLTLTIYEGVSPATGTPLGSASLSSIPTFPAVVQFDFSQLASPPQLAGGSNYCLEVLGNDVNMQLHCDSDVYAGGQALTKANMFAGYVEQPGNDLWFRTWLAQETTSLFLVDDAGNVGINNPAPQAALDVVGTVSATTVNVGDVLQLAPRADAPASPVQGDLYYDSTLNVLRAYDGTTWHDLW